YAYNVSRVVYLDQFSPALASISGAIIYAALLTLLWACLISWIKFYDLVPAQLIFAAVIVIGLWFGSQQFWLDSVVDVFSYTLVTVVIYVLAIYGARANPIAIFFGVVFYRLFTDARYMAWAPVYVFDQVAISIVLALPIAWLIYEFLAR